MLPFQDGIILLIFTYTLHMPSIPGTCTLKSLQHIVHMYDPRSFFRSLAGPVVCVRWIIQQCSCPVMPAEEADLPC